MSYSAHHTVSRKRAEPQQDEVEASSILVSLANHHPYSSSKKIKTDNKSMSIRNLLESDQQNSLREIPRPVTPPSFANARMQLSPESCIGQNMQPKAQMTIQHNQKSQFQRPSKRDFPPALPPSSCSSHQQQKIPNQQHTYYHSPPNSAMDYSRHYTRMKCNPKIRRNALQAYISYMTYTDIRRRRMGNPMHQHNTIPPASLPYSNSMMKPDLYSPHYHQQQQQQQQQQQLASPPYHHQHHQPPPPPPPPPPHPHPYHHPHSHHQQQHYYDHSPLERMGQPHPSQKQLLSPPPPASPNQRLSVQTKPPPQSSSSACSSPLDKRMSSPPASKVIVEQPLTAFLHHSRPTAIKNQSPPSHYHRFNSVALSPPTPRQYNGGFR